MSVSTWNHQISILQVLILVLTSSYLALKLTRSNLLYKGNRLALISMFFFFSITSRLKGFFCTNSWFIIQRKLDSVGILGLYNIGTVQVVAP